MYKITPNQKKFLIIWICFHSFALFTNVFNIEGKGIFTNYGYGHYSKYDDFWPFTDFTTQNIKYSFEQSPITGEDARSSQFVTVFKGIFANYDKSEYIFYIIIGLGIVFLPELWDTPKEEAV